MSDWNEQAAPNNNLDPDTISNSKLVEKKEIQKSEFAEQVSNELSSESKDSDYLNNHLKSRQPGM